MSIYKFLVIQCLLLFSISEIAFAQDFSAYKKDLFTSSGDTLPYRILLPENFSRIKKNPLILFLHGSGERGNDNELQLTHGADLFLNKEIRIQFPAIVVFPQCPNEQSWNNTKYAPTEDGYAVIYPDTIEYNAQQNLLEGLITKLRTTYRIDEDRLYVGGLSMGGMGTFELVRRNPNLFAAAITICGGAHTMAAASLSQTPLWIFHGDDDSVVPVSGSMDIYWALKEFNADVTMTIYHRVGHDSWAMAFAEPDLLSWLFSKQNMSN